MILDPTFTAFNRECLADKLSSHSMAVFFSSKRKRLSEDIHYPFAADRNFLYLTGLNLPNLMLLVQKQAASAVFALALLDDSSSFADITYRNEISSTGIQSLYTVEELKTLISQGFPASRQLYICPPASEPEEPWLPEYQFVRDVLSVSPGKTISLSNEIMSALRYVKQNWEIEQAERAAQLLAAGMNRVQQAAIPGMRERDVRAAYEGYLIAEGCDVYGTVCAAGSSAAQVHHQAGAQILSAEDALLFDAGAFVNGYWADATRTWPVGGAFSCRQKAVYELVAKAQELALDRVCPGVSDELIQQEVLAFYARYLPSLGVDHPYDVVRYYPHNIGHSLGLDIHDPRPADRTLRLNTLFTIEPGLYIPEWGIGVRIEDSVQVTGDGYRSLTAAIPKISLAR